MNRLIDDQGNVQFGIFESPIDEINYKDFRMSSPMGFTTPKIFKNLLFNQFVFFGLTGPDIIIGMAVVDLKYLSSGFLNIYDRKNGNISEANNTIVTSKRKIFISPSTPETSCVSKFTNLFSAR